MIAIVFGLKALINLNIANRLWATIYVAIIALIGSVVYFLVSHKIHLIQDIFGEDYLNKIKNKFLKRKKA